MLTGYETRWRNTALRAGTGHAEGREGHAACGDVFVSNPSVFS